MHRGTQDLQGNHAHEQYLKISTQEQAQISGWEQDSLPGDIFLSLSNSSVDLGPLCTHIIFFIPGENTGGHQQVHFLCVPVRWGLQQQRGLR